MNHPLLVEIQRFAVSSTLYHREEAPEGKKVTAIKFGLLNFSPQFQ